MAEFNNRETVTFGGEQYELVASNGACVIYAEQFADAEGVSGRLKQDIIDLYDTHAKIHGYNPEDIVTDYYGYYPVYDYSDPQGEPEITGYQANHSLVVTCRDVSMLDEVVSAMSDGGMTEFNSIAFDCTGRHELYLEALKRAVEAAREKAGVLAAASGLTLGKTEKVTENAVYDTVYEGASTDAAMESKRAQGTGIRSGSVNVAASVTVQFEAR